MIKVKELIWQGRLQVDLSVFRVCSHPDYQLKWYKLIKNISLSLSMRQISPKLQYLCFIL